MVYSTLICIAIKNRTSLQMVQPFEFQTLVPMISNGVWKPDHLTKDKIWTIWLPDLFGIQMFTVHHLEHRLIQYLFLPFHGLLIGHLPV
jgi:hypothetical protein